MTEIATHEIKASTVDISIESHGNLWYGFSNVPMANLAAAVEKAHKDHTVFSVANTDGAAIAIPVRSLRSISVCDVDETLELEGDETEAELDAMRTWTLVWESAQETTSAPAQVFTND